MGAQYSIEEEIIYSTFMTNKDILELFAVFGSVFGNGIPLAYFAFEARIE